MLKDIKLKLNFSFSTEKLYNSNENNKQFLPYFRKEEVKMLFNSFFFLILLALTNPRKLLFYSKMINSIEN